MDIFMSFFAFFLQMSFFFSKKSKKEPKKEHI